MITAGEGKYKVWLTKELIGHDLVLLLGGGEQSHIGGVVICEPGKEPQIIRLGNHYDYQVLQPLAETSCKKYNTTVAVIGGVHINNATKEEIDILIQNCRKLEQCI